MHHAGADAKLRIRTKVVRRQCQGEHPIDEGDPAMARLAQPANGFEPTEDLLYSFALALTGRVSRMAGGTLVDNALLCGRNAE
jgi:hypothetical protein